MWEPVMVVGAEGAAVVGPVVVAVVGATTAAAWPWLTSFQRRRRFENLIKRELAELTPHPPHRTDQPWWAHLTKRFVHEEIFDRGNLVESRDFLLTLDPTVTYLVNQLWIAFGNHDPIQWLHFLDELAANDRVASPGLSEAVTKWRVLLGEPVPADGDVLQRATSGTDPADRRPGPELFQARWAAYGSLLQLTRTDADHGSESLSDRLTDWYYEQGQGLLLSGDCLRTFLDARDRASDPDVDADHLATGLSALRTEMKIDLGVRDPDERHIELARTRDRRWF